MTPVKQHLHIGAGALGLGLICCLTHRAGLRVVLANRKYGSSDDSLARHYLLKKRLIYNVVDRDGRTEAVNLDDFIFFDEEADKFSDVVCHADTLLITFSVRDRLALGTVIPALGPALMKRARLGNPPVYIIACENAITSSDIVNGLHEHDPRFIDYPTSFIFPECVVDRICNEPTVTDALDIVTVRAEAFASWVICNETPGMFNLRDRLSPVAKDCVSFVHDIELYRKRKLWLVNGPHLLIALYLYYQFSDDDLAVEAYNYLPFLIEDVHDASDTLWDILLEAGEMFRRVYGTLPESFLGQVHARFSAEPDTLSRVLDDFREPSKDDCKALERMLSKLYRLVVSLCMDSNGNGMTIRSVVDMFVVMVNEGRYFVRLPQPD